ncbi:universal stress protein [Streptomyces roseus]|uniref:universal stress protein n=1 Tax=Streptomyces roseus TaxID=66430 RepID=UPI0033C2B6FF
MVRGFPVREPSESRQRTPASAPGRLHGIRQRTGRWVDAVGHRVVVGVSGSSGSLTALHRAAAEARWRGAQLWVVLAWQPPGGDLGSRGPGGVPTAAAVKAAAVERLRLALDTAFGPAGPGVALAGRAVRATAGAALAE